MLNLISQKNAPKSIKFPLSDFIFHPYIKNIPRICLNKFGKTTDVKMVVMKEDVYTHRYPDTGDTSPMQGNVGKEERWS